MGGPALELRHVSKSFGGVRALAGVMLTVAPGEVHALLGENGSGKSTLIKILAGYHAPDPGAELAVHGLAARLPLRPGEARTLGLSFVHQDLGLIPSLTVLENLRIGEFSNRRGGKLSWRHERRRARQAFARFGVRLDPNGLVAHLAPHERALLALIRAFEELQAPQGEHGAAGRLLVLDETTAFLPRTETEELFALVRGLAAAGASVLLVTHQLDEVQAVADRVTVLRDGRNAGTVATEDVDAARLVEMILGRQPEPFAPERSRATRQAAVSLGAVGGTAVRDLSLDLDAGEIVGLAGLPGSGYDEVPYLLFGAGAPRDGRVAIRGTVLELPRLSPARALAAGMALVPADRQRDGCVDSLSVGDNVSLPVLGRFISRLGLERGRLARHAAELLSRFDVRPRDPRLPYGALSGGNQQKALLAKSLQTNPALLLLHEPTQGVDVGARDPILALVDAAAARGASVLYAGSDHWELAAVCDRVLVFAAGRVAHELVGPAVTADRIAELCLGARVSGPSLKIPTT